MKKILAFTLALAMVLSTWTSTFAASKEVEALANLKLLLNTTDAEVNADLTRAVGLAMVLKALGYTQEDANAKMAENTFVDLDKAAWAKGFAKLGEDLKITNGTSVEPKLFSPNWKLNERAFVAFLLRALGHDVDAAWAKAGELAKENGLTETVSENKLTKGEAAVIMYNALKAKVVGDEKGRTLAEKLVADKKLDKELAVANGLISAEPEKLTVSAMADNLIEVKVMFDGTVEKDTATKVGNYKVKNRAVKEATLQEDGKTVVLRLEKALTNKAEQELTVSGVKNVAGKAMDKQTVKFTTNDVTAPTVEKVVVTGPKNLDITFSEPVDTTHLQVFVKQDKSLLTTKVGTQSNALRTVSVELYSNFKESAEYTVAVGNAKSNSNYAYDFAGYANPYFEETFTYAKDTAAPEAKVVKFDQKSVTLEFTKPVKGFVAEKDNVYHTFSAYKAVEVKDEEGNDAVANKTYTKLKFVFKNDAKGNALPAGKTTVVVLGKAAGNEVKDNWGNLLANANFDLEVVADREAPQVVSVELDQKTLTITFNESVLNKDAKFSLIDKDGKVVEKKEKTALALSKENKVMTVTLNGDYVGKTMTVKLEGVKDNSLYENMMPEYSEQITFEDKEFKGIEKVEFFRTGTTDANYRHFLYVTYKEEMDDSVLDTENYRLKNDDKDNVKIQGGADFLDGNRKIVAIELSYDANKADAETDVKFVTGVQTAAAVANNTKLRISDKIKDLAGNMQSIFASANELPINGLQADKFEVKEIRAVATDKVEVEFGAPIYDVDSNVEHYVLKSTGKEYKVVQVSKKSEKVLELIIAEDGNKPLLPVNAEAATVLLKFETSNLAVTDVFGRTVKPINNAQAVQVKDKIAPSVASIKYKSESTHTTAAAIFANAESKEEKHKDKPVIIVNGTLAEADGDLSATHKKFNIEIKYNEDIDLTSVSNTTFTFNKDVVAKGAVVAGTTANVVKLTVVLKNDEATKAKINAWEDFVINQVGTVKDVKGNAMQTVSNMSVVLFDVNE